MTQAVPRALANARMPSQVACSSSFLSSTVALRSLANLKYGRPAYEDIKRRMRCRSGLSNGTSSYIGIVRYFCAFLLETLTYEYDKNMIQK